MKRHTNRLLAAATLLAVSPFALADNGTDAGTTIANSATVTYKVGTVTQTAVDSNGGVPLEFLVDRRVNLSVTSDGDATVVPGSVDQVLTYTVTNSTNATMDFGLAATGGAGDDFDPANVQIFVESGATGGYQPAEDTATFIDELIEDATIKAYVVGDIPSTASDTQTGAIVLTATAKAAGASGTEGAALVEDVDADDPATVENVFGDAGGDGLESATGSYVVASATVGVAKSSVVISDPFNVTTNPKAIPGAVIQYCVLVSNTGGTAASDVIVSDQVPTGTTYVPGSLHAGDIDCTPTANSAIADGGSTATNGASGDFNVTQVGYVTTTVPNVAAGTDASTIFQVTID